MVQMLFCNLSVNSNEFSVGCEVAKLKPLFKKDAENDPSNYKSISLLPLFPKVIERVVHKQTNNLNESNLIHIYIYT